MAQYSRHYPDSWNQVPQTKSDFCKHSVDAYNVQSRKCVRFAKLSYAVEINGPLFFNFYVYTCSWISLRLQYHRKSYV